MWCVTVFKFKETNTTLARYLNFKLPESVDSEDDDRAAGHGLLPGQQRDSSGGRVRGKHTGVPLKFKPRPLPPVPLLP